MIELLFAYSSEITAIFALIFIFATFFFDDKKFILFIQATAIFFYALHLYFLEFFITALFLAIQVFRNIFFAVNFSRRIHTMGYIVFILLFIIINFTLNSNDSLSWLGMIGSMIGTTAFFLTDTKLIRWVFFCSTLPWLYYVFHVGTEFTIILQLTLFSSVLINIVRFDILKMK